MREERGWCRRYVLLATRNRHMPNRIYTLDMSTIPSEIRRTVTEPTYFDIITTTGEYNYGHLMVEVSLFFSIRSLSGT
jgi:hypothetical protein